MLRPLAAASALIALVLGPLPAPASGAAPAVPAAVPDTALAAAPVTSPSTPTAAATGAATAGDDEAAGSGFRARPARYEVHRTSDVPVRMSDGTVLRVDVYRPARADGTPVRDRFPVVLTQTPYNKNAPGTNFLNEFLVRRGYVQVIADVRGTGSSAGTWASFSEREQQDGAELVEWAHDRARGWSDGRVGLYGVSYGAINQLFTAARQPQGLRATFPIVPVGDVYRDVVASGGQIDAGFIPLWLGLVTATSLVPPAYTAVAPDQGLVALLQHAGGAAAFQLPTVAGAVAGGDEAYDGPFYRLRSPLSVLDRVTVPTFVVGGEYDIFQRGEPLVYERLRENGVATRFVLGPWTHLEAAAGAELATSGLGSMNELVLRWFDRYVRGDRGQRLDDVAPLTYYEIGSGQWRTAPQWLPGSTRAETLQLDGTAVPGSPGVLTFDEVTTPGVDRVLQVPVAGLCSRSASQWTAGILQTPGCETDNRVNDTSGISYETAPLEDDLHLLGPANARLFVSTTRQDGLLSVAVEDVAPDGSVDRLTGGWQLLSQRALDRSRSRRLDGELLQPFHPFTRASQEPATPGEVMRVDVEIFPTGAVLAKGHRLRVTVQQMDVPHLVPTAPQLVDSTGAVVTVHHGPDHPSRIVLPIRG